MKKILLSVVAVAALTASSVFGFYKADNFIDFLVHPNQMRVTLDGIGFNTGIGDSGVRLAVGLTGENGANVILNNLITGKKGKGLNYFLPAALLGVGYKTEMFGVGLGYQFKWINNNYQVHTPVLTATAMNNAFRINVPVHIGVGSGKLKSVSSVSTAIEARYYTGIQAFSHFRLYVYYGEGTSYATNDKKNNYYKRSSVGFQLRLYFGAMVGDILVEPIIRVQYNQALKDVHKAGGTATKLPGPVFDVTAANILSIFGGAEDIHLSGGYFPDNISGVFIEDPYRLGIALPVGFTANSDIVSLYLEPALSFSMIGGKNMEVNDFDEPSTSRKDPFYTFGYVLYGEIYIRPLPDLEWYFEAQTGGATTAGNLAKTRTETQLVFNTSTGIRWYF